MALLKWGGDWEASRPRMPTVRLALGWGGIQVASEALETFEAAETAIEDDIDLFDSGARRHSAVGEVTGRIRKSISTTCGYDERALWLSSEVGNVILP